MRGAAFGRRCVTCRSSASMKKARGSFDSRAFCLGVARGCRMYRRCEAPRSDAQPPQHLRRGERHQRGAQRDYRQAHGEIRHLRNAADHHRPEQQPEVRDARDVREPFGRVDALHARGRREQHRHHVREAETHQRETRERGERERQQQCADHPRAGERRAHHHELRRAEARAHGVAGEARHGHAARERGVGGARERGRRQHDVAHIDSRPVVHRAFGDQRDQRDRAERPQCGRAPAIAGFSVLAVRGMGHVRQHRRTRHGQHQRGQRRSEQQMQRGRHAAREQRAADRRAGHAAQTEHAVQPRHDRLADRFLDGARLGVHGDVERGHADAERREHDDQHPVVRHDEDQRAADAHRDAAREAGAARADARDPGADRRHRGNRAARHREQRVREHGRVQVELVAHGRHVHAPRGIHHPGDEEERHRRDAGAVTPGGGQGAMAGGGLRVECGIGGVVGHWEIPAKDGGWI
ncbi:hypothetical protein PT2222_10246 [Paraburkholderia tropica]